jgi:hypothetical protein
MRLNESSRRKTNNRKGRRRGRKRKAKARSGEKRQRHRLREREGAVKLHVKREESIRKCHQKVFLLGCSDMKKIRRKRGGKKERKEFLFINLFYEWICFLC